MLTITQTASEALDAIVASTEDTPETAGLRISQAVGENGQPGLMLSLVAAPEPTDQVVDGSGVPVFLEGDVASELADKVLDAQVQGDQVGFTLAPQA